MSLLQDILLGHAVDTLGGPSGAVLSLIAPNEKVTFDELELEAVEAAAKLIEIVNARLTVGVSELFYLRTLIHPILKKLGADLSWTSKFRV